MTDATPDSNDQHGNSSQITTTIEATQAEQTLGMVNVTIESQRESPQLQGTLLRLHS